MNSQKTSVVMNQKPGLMLVTDRARSRLTLPDLVRAAVAGGVNAIQVRERDLTFDELRTLTAEIVDTVDRKAWVVVNSNLDVAKSLGIGIHLAENGPSIIDARTILGGEVIVGKSVHSLEAAKEANGADYLIAGHLFPTVSKPGLAPMELDTFAKIADSVTCPVLAIGGITAATVRPVLNAGAAGVAVIGAISDASDPRAAAAEIRASLDNYLKALEDNETLEITVTVNGKQATIPEGLSVSEFLASRDLHERLVVVEFNGEILKRAKYPSTRIAAGDQIEIVHFVGGG